MEGRNSDLPLPVIDFADFGDGTSSEALKIGNKLVEACRGVGFAYLINTGITQARVDEVFTWCRKFFNLPLEIKQLAPHPKEGWKHRGYSGIGVEQISQMVFDEKEIASIRERMPDFKESFDLGRTDSPHLENIWLPEGQLPGFREAALSFYYSCRSFQMEKLLKALSLGLSLPADFLASYHQDGDNQLRLLHYPAASADVFARGEKGRAKAHTDFGTATILFQDDVSGLEVESPHGSGQFVPVPPMPGSLVFNVGDLLMRWSNDTLKSTLHRVRAPSDDGTGMVKERYSIPFKMGQSKITIDVSQGIATITLDEPQRLNALSPEDYDDFANSLREIDKRDDVVVTVWQANGSWFCAGTNVKTEERPVQPTIRDQLRDRVVSANTDCTQAGILQLYTHSKVLVAALNGPVMVPEVWLYVGFPFLGIAVEGGASVNFVNRMGLAAANEVLLFNKKKTAKELLECGFVNKIFPSQSSESFHAAVRQHLLDELDMLHPSSVLSIKSLIKAGLAEKNNPDALNLRESYVQARMFSSGVPSVRFGMVARKEIKHKL
ncbi:hypothetical protein ID866_1877 [Astraeus odoratus]|nr:hypothetical protein ID866_1877 [Astraeus odoratus]